MDKTQILELLRGVEKGNTTPEEALLKLKLAPFEDLGYAKIDFHRQVRQGAAEVIYGQNKTPEQILGIVNNMVANGMHDILITRMNEDAAQLLKENMSYEHYPIAKVGIVNRDKDRARVGSIVVASGGTSDMAVCEEAALTAECMGSHVTRIYDVGVAGLHRLLSRLDEIMQARVVIAVAGMEGALASVLGGLVDCPVIAVPTSVGYGANFGGLSALLSMLNSCASGVSVVNIDNGFGAGYLADRINKMEGIK